MKVFLGRVFSVLIVVGGWLLFGARSALDVVGYSTAPEDIEVAKTRLDKAIDLLLSAPWWSILGFALVTTLVLMYVSWPRQSGSDSKSLPKWTKAEKFRNLQHKISPVLSEIQTVIEKGSGVISPRFEAEVDALHVTLEKQGLPTPRNIKAGTSDRFCMFNHAYLSAILPYIRNGHVKEAKDAAAREVLSIRQYLDEKRQ